MNMEKKLFNNPRGIGCNNCHGDDAKGKKKLILNILLMNIQQIIKRVQLQFGCSRHKIC